MATSMEAAVHYYDEHPAPADFFAEVLHGLGKQPKRIPPKFFYDERGSELFDAICHTPEYYPTRTEQQLLRRHAGEIAALIGNRCLLIEPGSGNSEKVRLLLDDLRPAAYLPMDISRDFLFSAAGRLAREYPWLEVHATCVDFTAPLALPHCPDGMHRVVFFPGSSIGNFEPAQAREFLANLAAVAGPNGSLLIGVDLKKDPTILNAAYNDAAGMTAAFNLNLLSRINRELDADILVDNFSHRAFYNTELGRIEMHLVSNRQQTFSIAGSRFELAENETIHTENSYKYTPEEFIDLAAQAGFHSRRVWTDRDNLFSLHYFDTTQA